MGPALHDLLLASASRDPDHAAILSGNDAMSYGALARAAGRLASTLRRLGVAKGDRVAIVIDGPEFAIAYYGVAMAGAIAVPLSDDARQRSLISTLAHAKVRAVVIGGRNTRLLAGQEGSVPELAAVLTVGPSPALETRLTTLSLEAAIADGDELVPTRFEGARGDDLVAIQYTSGTTGEKKGVMLTHRNLRANAASIVEYLELERDDIAGLVLPFYYVYGGSVLHTHFAVGGTLAMLGSVAFPIRVVEALARYRCTGLPGVPSTFARLLALDDLSRFDLSALRYLTQAGAAMSKEMAARVRAAFPSARLFIMYGQTEASARLSYLPPQDIERKAGSVGIGIPGVELSVRRPDGARAAMGEVGEVVARGANITPGYLGNPEATARALRPEGLHTGDLGFLDADGYLFLVGRESEMIKSGAHRIAPREIEEAVELLPEVQQCAVAGKPDAVLGEVVAAFVVLEEGATLSDKELLSHCREELPRFKIPSDVRFVAELPRTENGKLTRRALRDLLLEESRVH